MTTQYYPDFFNDVFGPIMQPGSSGGFAGMARIGNIARDLAGGDLSHVSFQFRDPNKTLAPYFNFMSDRGLLGGLLGFLPDDERLFDAYAHAEKAGVTYDFGFAEMSVENPESLVAIVTRRDGSTGSLVASSVGGGMVVVHEVNGFPLTWKGDTFALISEELSLEQAKEKYAEKAIRILPLAQKARHATAILAEFSEFPQRPKDDRSTVLRPVLPVVTQKDKRPQLFRTMEEWRAAADSRGISFAEAAIEYEISSSGLSRTEILEKFEEIAAVLEGQIHALEKMGYENATDTPNLPIYGKLWNRYTTKREIISDNLTAHIIRHAMSTNAKIPGVKIVPAPMGTGGGYLFSALDAVREKIGATHEQLIEALLVAAGLGAIAFTYSNCSGHDGCTAESGICCAMAAGATCYLAGGDAVAVENAASMALQSNLGIPCDFIPGGLEFPCITRTIRAAVTAPLYADLALSGMDALIPYHEVLQSIASTRNALGSDNICGQDCGICQTPTAKQIMASYEATIIAKS
ncbi:MAG: L-serine ammonia-lyase, iron-sulfur-dependent, subunit alpha [Clostridiales Family XIII bacterium]|jgi:L-serine dehydratase|nr:L-serine ammonia-lyase, iron-sulfur-dependent, subunit alpha [Clostridiales Family XIII bacterium]